jgi:hypothetical protein
MCGGVHDNNFPIIRRPCGAFAFTLHQLLLKISARRGNNEMETTHHRVQHVEMSTALCELVACSFNFPGATISMRRGVFHKLPSGIVQCECKTLRESRLRFDLLSLAPSHTHGTCADCDAGECMLLEFLVRHRSRDESCHSEMFF